MNPPPEVQQNPRPCKVCDTMVALGLLTATCEDITDPQKKSLCRTTIQPLENGKSSSVDTLTQILYLLGDKSLDQVTDRWNLMIFEATEKARDLLIKDGKLNKDGTAKT